MFDQRAGTFVGQTPVELARLITRYDASDPYALGPQLS